MALVCAGLIALLYTTVLLNAILNSYVLKMGQTSLQCVVLVRVSVLLVYILLHFSSALITFEFIQIHTEGTQSTQCSLSSSSLQIALCASSSP